MVTRAIAGVSGCVIGVIASATLGLADSGTPVNFIGVNFDPITSSTSSNYDWSTGTLSSSTASASVFSSANVVQHAFADPSPPDPNGFGTFIGTAEPTRFDGDTVLYEQSACPTATCFSDGTFTFGYMFMYHLRGDTLDQLTNLATDYNVQNGCFGGGSPRFSIITSKAGPSNEIHVYLGSYPAFADCPPPGWVSTGNLASDAAGLRWDTSELCPGTFYNSYSGAVTCANSLGLTISAVLVGTDGGWSGTNAGNPNGQTFLFRNIQVNGATRFP